MKKRPKIPKQLDFFAPDITSIKWEQIPERNRQELQSLMAQLILSRLTIEPKQRESHHAK